MERTITEQREFREKVGEAFIEWADKYFSTKANLNKRIQRHEMFDSFYQTLGPDRKNTNPFRFKKCILAYCEYHGFYFNNHHRNFMVPAPRDISQSKEYFTISNTIKYKLRAESSHEIIEFLGNIHEMLKSFTMLRDPEFPDVELEFETDLALDEIVFTINDQDDAHVMAETVKPIHEYTGERD